MKPVYKTRKNDSGVSETVGYIIIFGIMMAGIALVSLYGYPLLVNQQATSNIQNMERNMISLQTDINTLTFKNVPYKESTVQVSGGTLSVDKGNANTPFFTITNSSGTLFTFKPGNIHFREDSQGAYVELLNGAVVQRYSGQAGSVMISDPRWYYDGSQHILVIPMINITSSYNMANSGISTIQMAIEHDPVTITYDHPGAVDFSYGQGSGYTNSDDIYRKAWENYLNVTPFNMVTYNGALWDNYTFNPNPQISKLVIKLYTVNITSV
jgi:hypothetical protein